MTGPAPLVANPFSTCWIRPDRCRYRFTRPGQLEQILDDLLQAGGGQITGPHGVGKSTLLFSLLEALTERGHHVSRYQLHAGQRQSGEKPDNPILPAGAWLAIDGFEQLPAWRRWRLAWRCRRRQIHLVVTSHRQHRFPFTWSLSPGLDIACCLVDQLQQDTACLVTDQDVACLFQRHDGNLRELLFACYDLFEQRMRRQR